MDERPAVRRVVHDGRDVVIVARDSQRPCGVITFSAWSNNPPRIAPADSVSGFGEGVFLKDGLDELHVIARRNHWYQTEEHDAVLACVRRFAAQRRTITYGASMGGYGAALFSHLLDVPGLCFSPQFSLHPSVAPFERRWLSERKDMPEFERGLISRNRGAQGYSFHDPFCRPDDKQAKLFRALTDYRVIRCAFTGHGTAGAVNQRYGLSRIVREVLEDRFDVQAFLQEMRAARATDPAYLVQLYFFALRRARRPRPELAAQLLERFKPLADRLDITLLQQLCTFDQSNGNTGAAQHWLALSEQLPVKDPMDFLHRGRMLKALGRDEDALSSVRRGLKMSPGHATLLSLAQRWSREAVC